MLPNGKGLSQGMATAASEAPERAGKAPDPGALLAGLFDAHARTVYALCAVLLRDAHEAEDAAQQAFLSAFEAIEAGTLPGRPDAWLLAIARNECLDRLRRRARRPESPLEREPPSPGADVVAERNAALAALCDALRDLPERQRDALVLHEVCGLGYRQVAATLGVSTAAVESLIFRARRQLGERAGTVRALAAAIALPLGLRESVATGAPGLAGGSLGAGAAAGGSAAPAAGIAASLTAKVLALPIASKLAVAAAVVMGAGSVGYGVEWAAGGGALPQKAPLAHLATAVQPGAFVRSAETASPGTAPEQVASAPAAATAVSEAEAPAVVLPAEPEHERSAGSGPALPETAGASAPGPEPPSAVREEPASGEQTDADAEPAPPEPEEQPPAGTGEDDQSPSPADVAEPSPGGDDGAPGEDDPADPPPGDTDEAGGAGEGGGDADEPGGGDAGEGGGAGDTQDPPPEDEPPAGSGQDGEEVGSPADDPGTELEARCRRWRWWERLLHASLDEAQLERWHALGVRLGCLH